MSDKVVSENGKGVGVSTVALEEAIDWYGKLADAEFRGRGDREKAVRGRISDKTGISESYLFRLQYKAREMRDIAGDAYRRLHLAYVDLCEKNEKAAGQARAQRLEITHAAHMRADQQDHRSGTAVVGEKVEQTEGI